MIIGTVIGSGIFLVPGTILRSVGNSVPLAALVWLAGGVLSLLGALTYGELSAARPRAGGLYVYIRDCFGPLTRILVRLDLLPRHQRRLRCNFGGCLCQLPVREFYSACPLARKSDLSPSDSDHHGREYSRHTSKRKPDQCHHRVQGDRHRRARHRSVDIRRTPAFRAECRCAYAIESIRSRRGDDQRLVGLRRLAICDLQRRRNH